jgi:DNA-binding beta-propeller fold protein YncE
MQSSKSVSLAALVLLLGLRTAAADDGAMKVSDVIKIGGAGGWDYAAVDDTHHVLYLSHGTAIASVNLGTRSVNPHFADAKGAHIALPVQDGSTILVTHGNANEVTLNDSASGAVLARIATDTSPDAAILEPLTARAFVMANRANTVDVVDLPSHAVVARIAVPGAPEAAAVDGKGLVFTHLEDKNAIAVLDAKKMALVTTYPLPGCEGPSGIAYVPQRALILSACRNGIARFTDVRSGAAVVSVPIGQHPDGALVDAQRALAFVPCGDGTLAVIRLDGAVPKSAATVTTRTGARTAALDPATGNVYLPVADLGAPPAPGQRPAVVPDTFSVIVVSR